MKTKNTPEITPENYEDYFLLSLDGELSNEEETALQAFLHMHPSLAESVAGYEVVKIPLPQMLPLFEGKEALLKPEVEASPKTRSFRPFLWAAAALLLLWMGVRFLPSGEEIPQVAIGRTPVKTVLPQPRKPEEIPSPIVSSKPGKTAEKTSPKPVFSLPQKQPSPAPPQETVIVAVSVRESISPLPFQQRPLALLPLNIVMPEVAKAVTVTLPVSHETPVPGLEINLPVFQELRTAAAEKVMALRDARRSLKETEATVSIGNRELFTIRF